MPALPIPLAIAEGRRALAQMYIELTLAFPILSKTDK
ncbi:hypothetical protein ACVMGC_000995 [Bradyrhizobium barranii subsp. barranii]|nr:hypothetical protein [Bradyrhizobium japonicum]MCP1958151.1 hypothetical protein [Bradyrhizobium japonicum]